MRKVYSRTDSSVIHPILTRLGIDMLSGRLLHLRDDERFRAVGPDSFVISSQNAHGLPHHPQGAPAAGPPKPEAEEGEIWFDWAFVDFWKSNYCESSRSSC